MRGARPGPAALAATALALALTPAAGAEEVWPAIEIEVSKTARPASDLPAEVTVLPAPQIEEARVTTIRRLADQVPAIRYVHTGSPVEAPLAMRGQGNYGIGEASVGTFLDGVAVTGDSMVNLDLLDVERIEVMRGPQSVLFGHDSVAGAINLIPRAPSPVPEARLDQMIGDGGTLRSTVSLSGPIDADGALRLALARDETGGMHRSLQGQAVESDRSLAGRLSASYWVGDATQVLPAVSVTRRRAQAYPYRRAASPVDYDGEPFSRDQRNPAEIEASLASLKVEHMGGPWVLSSLSSWSGTHESLGLDADYSAAPNVYLTRRLVRDDVAQEVRLASPRGAPWSWLVGVHAWRQTQDLDSAVMFGGPGGIPLSRVRADTEKTSLAAFGRTEIPLGETWGLEAGLRLARDGREQHGSAGAQSAAFNHATPALALIWRPDPGWRAWASWRRGMKAGGFNPGPYPAYRSERTTTWEAGGRYQPDEGIELWGSVFRTLVDGQQMTDADVATTTEYIVNKGRVLIVGLEGGGRLPLGGGVGVEVSGIALDGRYKGYMPVKTGPGGITAAYDLSGRQLQAIPSYQAQAALVGDHPLADGPLGPLRLVWRLALRAVGPHYWDEFNTARQASYRVLDASVGLVAGPATLRLFVDNLGDTAYFTNYVPAYRFAPAGGANLGVRGDERRVLGELALDF